jgi:hypothetical protein
MQILLTGASGFVGKKLINQLVDEGHQVVATTRNIPKYEGLYPTNGKWVSWDSTNNPLPASLIGSPDAVINLMGENIGDKRWSEKRKKKLVQSRVEGTKNLIEGLKAHKISPKVFIQASAIGFYPSNTANEIDENSPMGSGFLSSLCQKWEASAFENKISERLVILRIGMIVGNNGGALAKLYPIFKFGLGGPIGLGHQMMSWIHRNDLVDLILFALKRDDFSGIYNATSPNPISNTEFTKALSRSIHRPALFPVPPVVLKMAMGEMSQIVLDSQIVLPKRTLQSGFTYAFPKIELAIQEAITSWKQ